MSYFFSFYVLDVDEPGSPGQASSAFELCDVLFLVSTLTLSFMNL